MISDNGFELITEEPVEEINATARIYRHQKTGARVLSMISDDTNKVFGITFRTPPEDSTGIAHILEHSVLCGSEKYPVKEPFVELMKGSLQTFLNAFTYPDKTCYPVASENLKDFYNLMDVYLDAVFHPRITPHTLEQEGWHYELDDVDSPLTYKGVVFNEMKGVYSNPEDVLGELAQQSLFPDTTYGVDSGGNPKHIPDLTYEQFKDFHETLYHPSNAYIYFYGDDDPEERLNRIATYLNDFDAKEVDSGIALQANQAEPQRVIKPYDPGEEQDEEPKAFFSTNWLLPEVTHVETNLALSILGYSLIGTSAGPLRKALIDSGLGEDLTGPGFANFMRQIYFGTGLRGIAEADIPKAEQLIHDTLVDIARDGLDPDLLDAAINTTEFKMREQNTGGYPRGLAYMLSSLVFWLYDADPLEPLRFEAPLQRLKDRLARGEPVFQDLVRTHFVENLHRTTVELRPEAGFSQRDEDEERAKLAELRAGFDRAQLEAICENTRVLKEMQEAPDAPEALATIPHLGRDDLELKGKTVPLAVEEQAEVKVLFHDLFTNGILYVDVGFDFGGLPSRLVPYLSLYGQALLEMGTQKEDYVSLANRIGKHTGGVGPGSLVSSLRNRDGAATWFFLRGKSTLSKVDDLLAIFSDVLLLPNFADPERFRQIVLEEKASYESSLVPSGHSVADTRLRSGYGLAEWLGEQQKGVSHLFFLREISERIDSDWASIQADLEAVHAFVINRAHAVVNVTVDAANWRTFAPKLKGFLDQLPHEERSGETWNPAIAPTDEGLAIPAKVNFVAKGANIYQAGYGLHGSAAVITNYLRAGYLWDRVRVQGGAYGAFCSLDSRSGIFTFGSYRDPNIEQTVSVYDAASAFLREQTVGEAELTKSIIGAIGTIDAYRLPDARGYGSMVRHLTGETDAWRQQFREELLATTPQHIRDFADAMDAVRDAGSVVVVGSQEAMEKAGGAFGGDPTITRVM